MRPKGFEPKRVATKLPEKCERENDKQKKDDDTNHSSSLKLNKKGVYPKM